MEQQRKKNAKRKGGKAQKKNRPVALAPKRKQPKKQNMAVVFIGGLMFLVVLLYLGKGLVDLGNKTDVQSVAVQMGNVDVPVVLDGIIVREERVYVAPKDGLVSYNYNDMDRVKKGATICGISDEVAVAQLASDIDAIKKEILKLQDRRTEITAFKKDVDNVNRQIKEIVDNKVMVNLQDDMGSIYESKESIARNLSLRNQMLLNESRGSLTGLVDDKQRMESAMNKSFSNIYAENSGLLSYIVDGLEESLNFKTVGTLTPEQTRMKVNYDQLVRSRNVAQNESVFKIVEANEWYIAAYIPMEMVFDWEERQTKTIYLQMRDSFSSIDMTVDKIAKGENEYYIILKSTKNIIDYMHMRNVKFKISNSERKGFKIPTSAIADRTLLKIPKRFLIEGEPSSVIKHTEALDEKVTVDVQSSDEDFVYILQNYVTITKGDTLKEPVEPYNYYEISEIVNVKGVFVINRGYAEFKKIELESEISAGAEYVILKPELNTGLKIHDRIISEGGSVSEKQKIIK